MKKKLFFAQAAGGKSQHFESVEEAREWLQAKGGGEIKKRHAKVIHASGTGFGRVEFNPPLRVWRVVEEVPAPRYIRKPEHDKRIAHGDDCAGDAYLDTQTAQMIWWPCGTTQTGE